MSGSAGRGLARYLSGRPAEVVTLPWPRTASATINAARSAPSCGLSLDNMQESNMQGYQ